jgi:DNA-binding FadR family transcriptional regulator
MIGPVLRIGRRISLERRPDGPADSQRGHRRVLDAIREGNPGEAREAMREHLSWTANLTLDEAGVSRVERSAGERTKRTS